MSCNKILTSRFWSFSLQSFFLTDLRSLTWPYMVDTELPDTELNSTVTAPVNLLFTLLHCAPPGTHRAHLLISITTLTSNCHSPSLKPIMTLCSLGLFSSLTYPSLWYCMLIVSTTRTSWGQNYVFYHYILSTQSSTWHSAGVGVQ